MGRQPHALGAPARQRSASLAKIDFRSADAVTKVLSLRPTAVVICLDNDVRNLDLAWRLSQAAGGGASLDLHIVARVFVEPADYVVNAMKGTDFQSLWVLAAEGIHTEIFPTEPARLPGRHLRLG